MLFDKTTIFISFLYVFYNMKMIQEKHNKPNLLDSIFLYQVLYKTNDIIDVIARLDFFAFIGNLEVEKCVESIWYTESYKISKLWYPLRYLVEKIFLFL